METAMDQDTIISLRNVCKGYRSKKGIRRILDDVSFDFRGGENLAILGGNGSGKSVLLRMICGMELPDSGTVQRAVSISYPLGFAGGISSNMTGRDNVRFIARIYGCDVPDVERFVYDFSELGRSFDLPVVTYANSMRARLSYGISMALRCDVYVVDEMAAVGDVNFKRKCLEVFAERSRGATIIMAANAPTTVRRFCSHGVIMQHGLKRMVEKQENVFYYLTLLNENYPMPGLKAGTEEQIIKGMYLLEEGQGAAGAPRVNLLGSGTILRESQFARQLLAQDWGVAANVWSCPSFNELARDGQDAERFNLLHPTATPKVPFVAQQLQPHIGPVVASTDYMKNYADQIRAFIPRGRSFKVLGTDGFGRSDFRSKLREHFEINRHYIVVAALRALADEGAVPTTVVAEAIAKYGIKADKINPLYA